MIPTLAMYDKSFDHIGARLAQLGLDLKVMTFSKDNTFLIDGRKVAPEEVSVDYVWLSSHVGPDGFRDGVFGLLQRCKSIGVIQTFNAGLDDPFYKAMSDRGTRICNSSAQGVAIAEYILGQVMAVLQPIEQQRELQRMRQWKNTPFREVSQTNWLLIGFGPIGQQLAQRLRAFGARVDVVRRTPEPSPFADRVCTTADLPRLLPDADVIVLACPLNAETRGLAGKSFFEKAKAAAILVNIARGGLVDDAALIAALDSGKLSTAILDVFNEEPLPADNPLWSHKQVRLTAHMSNAGNGSRGRWDALFLDSIVRYAKGEPLLHEVRPSDI